jgi:hypothetical protein
MENRSNIPVGQSLCLRPSREGEGGGRNLTAERVKRRVFMPRNKYLFGELVPLFI